MARETLEETLRRRGKDGQGEHFAVEVQRDIAAQLVGKILEDLRFSAAAAATTLRFGPDLHRLDAI